MFFLLLLFFNLDAPGLSNTIRLRGLLHLRNVHVAVEEAQRKHVHFLDWIYLWPQVWQWIIWLNSSVAYQVLTGSSESRHASGFFLSKRHFKKHYRTLVSRGMPLNKHINWEKQSTCHTLTNTRRDWNAKNLLIEWNPAGNHRRGCTL